MPEIKVNITTEDQDGWIVRVDILEPENTSHIVSVGRATLKHLGRKQESVESFVGRCFEFLLKREPAEAILKSFDIRDIGRYFPEFESIIKK